MIPPIIPRQVIIQGRIVWIDPAGRRWLDAAGTIPVPVCANCGGMHETAGCPIPEGYDPADWRRDSKGSGGCGCKE